MPGKSAKTTNVTVRVPNDLLDALRKRAKRKGVSVSSLIVKGITKILRNDNSLNR